MFDGDSNRFLGRVSSSSILRYGSLTVSVESRVDGLTFSVTVRIPISNFEGVVGGERSRRRILPAFLRMRSVSFDKSSSLVIVRSSGPTADDAVKGMEESWRNIAVLIADLSVTP